MSKKDGDEYSSGKVGDAIVNIAAAEPLGVTPLQQTDSIACGDTGKAVFIGGEALRTISGWFAVVGHPLGVDWDAVRNWDWRTAWRELSNFDGAFTALCWDGASERLVVVTDVLGLQPIHIQRSGVGVVLSTCTRAFRGSPDLSAWGAFVGMGHSLGDHTLMEDVERMPPASIMIFDGSGRKLDERCYWQWRETTSSDPMVAAEALEESIQAYTELATVPTRLPLSGGFDSRLLLYALRHCGLEPGPLIVSHADEHADADGRIALALARHAGARAEFVQPDPDFFSGREYLRYVTASDAGMPSMNLFIAKLVPYLQDGAFWDGLVPGFALRMVFTPDQGFTRYRREKVRPYDSKAWKAAGIVFKEDVAGAMYSGFEQLLDNEIARFPDTDAGIFRFIAANRIRHRTCIGPLKVLAQHATPLLPGMTRAFFESVAGLPQASQNALDFYFRLFAQRYTAALELPFLKGGQLIPAHGGKWLYRQLRWAEKRERFFALHPSLDPWHQSRANIRVSAFLNADDALLEVDDAVDIDRIRRVERNDPLFMPVRTLLFHWKAWRWLHNGELMERLGPYSVQEN